VTQAKQQTTTTTKDYRERFEIVVVTGLVRTEPQSVAHMISFLFPIKIT